jgi:prevent-host-death family protein
MTGNLTYPQLSYKMLYMRKATNISIRELQQNLKRVIARVERGQIVEVTRHRRPVARLAPMRLIDGAAVPAWPDLGARTRAVFGDRLVMPGPSQMVIEDRGER